MAHEDLYEQIEKRRTQLEAELEELRSAKDAANKRWNADIKTRLEALSKLPRPPINRPKKHVPDVELMNEPTMSDRVASLPRGGYGDV
jgi:hypothetical protein